MSKKDDGPKNKRGRGTKKIPVVELVERNGNVYTRIQKKLNTETLNELVRQRVNAEFSTVITE
jgi:hypothetical protein